MSPEPRFVFDTSVIVSALLFDQSLPAQAFYTARLRGEILQSQATYEELSSVLSRKKLDRYLTPEDRTQFLTRFLREATLVDITDDIRVGRDPKDDRFLELIASGGASCLVTGDQ